MAPRHSAAVVSSVPKHKKAVLCLMGHVDVLAKLQSGSSVGCAFSVNGSKYVLNKVSLFIYF